MLLLATLRYRLLHPGTPSTIKSIFRSSPLSLDFGDGLPTGSLGDRFASLPSLLYRAPAMDFDSCLGFPGEGPTLPVLFRVGVWVVVFVPLRGCLGAPCRHGALEPRNAGDTARQVFRRERPLPEGRSVERATQSLRDTLWAAFLHWLQTQAISETVFLDGVHGDIDLVNAVMARYGRALYEGGRPYNHYAETVNALAGRYPKIRRLLQPAWDVAFQWQRLEPHTHHQAMPWQILLALLTASLLWGWVDVAGLLALAWGGLARIGEVFAAYRRDLVLPSDVQQTVDYILLAIREPKTRNTAARHQALRLDQPQLMRVVELAFRKRHRLQKLWLYSPGTFRVRFAKRVEALQLDQLKDRNVRPLDLGSLRAGGATWLLQATENGEFVRRRGRWLNSKIMEIYIQEVSSVLFLSRLRGDVANNVLEVMRLFPHMLEQAEIFMQYGFPPTTWFSLSAVGRASGPGCVGQMGGGSGMRKARCDNSGGAEKNVCDDLCECGA